MRIIERRAAHANPLALAALAWISAAAIHLVAEAITASAFPGYSYRFNFISDLGIPYITVTNGREINSPLAMVMNASFLAQSALLVVASLAVGRGLPRRGAAYTVFLAAALFDAGGLALIANVHSGSREMLDGSIVWHEAGAAMSIIGGNLLAMSSGFALAPLGMPRFYRPAGILLGLLGLVSIGSLVAGFGSMPAGLVERGGVYPITIWQVMTGWLLLAGSRGGR